MRIVYVVEEFNGTDWEPLMCVPYIEDAKEALDEILEIGDEVPYRIAAYVPGPGE